MMSIRNKTEVFFNAWSRYVVRHSKLVLCMVLAVTAAVLPQLRHITIDLSSESNLAKNDPSVADYDAFREQFGNVSFGLVTVETKDDIFTLENLRRLRALHEDLEENVPYMDKLTSLMNVRYSHGEGDVLRVEELSKIWPKIEEEIPVFRSFVLNNPTYIGSLVSSSGRLTSIILEPNSYTEVTINTTALEADHFEETIIETQSPGKRSRDNYLTPDEEAAFVETVLEIRDRHQVDGFRVFATGIPIVNYSMANDMGKAMMRNMGIGLLLTATLLYILFRRISGVLLPLMTVWLSVMMTIAFMPLLGYPLNANTQILPTFLLAIGVADAVHILSVFFRFYDSGMEKHTAIIRAMQSTAVAIVMTTVTTALGLMSFFAADLVPTRTLGMFGAIGSLLALYYTIALIPALLAILPIRRRMQDKDTPDKSHLLFVLDKAIFKLGDFGVHHARGVLICSFGISLLALLGITRVEFSHDPLRWYSPEHPIRVASELVDSQMSGTLEMQLVFDTKKDHGIHEPAFLQFLDKAIQHIETRQVNTTKATQAISILGVVKETHKSLNANDQAFYRIPDTREAIAQELLLFESSGTNDIEDFTDSSFQLARVSLLLPWSNAIGFEAYIDTLRSELNSLASASGMKELSINMTGINVIFARTLRAMLTGTMKSYALAFVLVGALMILLMGNLRNGVLAFIPNVTPVIITLGMMGWLGIPLNMLTSLIGCIIIGIAVDDTIHFMHHYRHFAETESEPRAVVHKTLDRVGRALFFTSIVLVGGFIVHTFDEFASSRYYGILLSFSIIIALLANLVLAPALMTMFWRTDKNRNLLEELGVRGLDQSPYDPSKDDELSREGEMVAAGNKSKIKNEDRKVVEEVD